MRLRSGGSDLVFHNRDVNFLRDVRIREVFRWAFKKVGLAKSGTRVTRHTWGTLSLLANRSDYSPVQRTMGHKHRSTTEIYGRPLEGVQGEAVNLTASLMGIGRSAGIDSDR